MDSKRIQYLDIAKAILIMLMVLGHVFLEGPIRHYVYVFHMPAFLVISGIQFRFSSALKKNFVQFILSRVTSLIIPFLFFEAIGVCYHILCFGVQQNLFGYLNNTLTQNWNNGAVGFLVHLFGAEVILYLVLKNIHQKKHLIIICAILFVVGFLPPKAWDSIFRIILIYGGFGILGFLSFETIRDYSSSLLFLCLSFAVTILVSFLCIYLSDCFGNPLRIFIYLAGSIAGSFLVLGVSILIRESRFLSFLGQNTIIILGTHNAFLFPIRRFLFPETSGILGFFVFLIIMVMELPTIYLMNRFFPVLIGRKSRNNTIK